MKRPAPPAPGRVRSPRGAYGWVDLKVVTGGWLEKLGPDAALVYLFLCTVGNTQGVSFWGRGRIAQTLGLGRETIDAAIGRLVRTDLIATREHVVQVLPVPSEFSEPALPAGQPLGPEPVVDESTLAACEPEARQMLSRVLGSQQPAAATLRALTLSLARRQAPATSPGERAHERGDDDRD